MNQCFLNSKSILMLTAVVLSSQLYCMDMEQSANWPLLHQAVFSNDLRDAVELLNHGAQINEQDDIGRTPISIAAEQGHFEMVGFLIRQGANFDIVDYEGRIPLHHAVIKKFLKVFRALIAAGAYVNDQDSAGMTPLHYAVQNEMAEMVRVLVTQGACIDIGNADGQTACDLADPIFLRLLHPTPPIPMERSRSMPALIRCDPRVSDPAHKQKHPGWLWDNVIPKKATVLPAYQRRLS